MRGEGELSVAPKLLRVLDLQGKLVTGDAAFTQRNLSIQVVKAGGEYVWKVKANQPTLHADIERLFEPPPQPALGFNTPKTDFLSSTETNWFDCPLWFQECCFCSSCLRR